MPYVPVPGSNSLGFHGVYDANSDGLELCNGAATFTNSRGIELKYEFIKFLNFPFNKFNCLFTDLHW